MTTSAAICVSSGSRRRGGRGAAVPLSAPSRLFLSVLVCVPGCDIVLTSLVSLAHRVPSR